MDSLDDYAKAFTWFASHVFQGNSPLYAELAEQIAADAKILAFGADCPAGQPLPNLLFAAVQYLLLSGVQHPLAAHFPSVTGGEPEGGENAYAAFRAFCRSHGEAIRDLIRSRRVQTNEVQRCASWLPAIETVSRLAGRAPLTMIEVGASAGLNLSWDRYGYDYGDGRRVGDPDAPLVLTSTLQGAHVPPLPETMPAVAARVGIDLNPIDVREADEALWLRALIWPEQAHRAANLEAAIAVARRYPPPLVRGDVFERLPDVLANLAASGPVCVLHSFTLYQFTEADRERFAILLDHVGAERELYHLSMEWYGKDLPKLELRAYRQGRRSDHLLAQCDQHGHWLEWGEPHLPD